MKAYSVIMVFLLFQQYSFAQSKRDLPCAKVFNSSSPTDSNYNTTCIQYTIHAADSLGFSESLIDARWRLFCLYCDSTICYEIGEPKTTITCTVGELDLEIGGYNYGLKEYEPEPEPVTEISFSYRLLIPGNLTDYLSIPFPSHYCGFFYSSSYKTSPSLIFNYYGVVSQLKMHRKLPKLDSTIRDKIRIYNPMQPEVINYIRTHSATINQWFLAEAHKRGVFDSVKYPPQKVLEEIEFNQKHKQDYLHSNLYLYYSFRETRRRKEDKIPYTEEIIFRK